MQQFKRVFFSLIFTCDLIIKSLRVFRLSKKAKEAHYAIFFQNRSGWGPVNTKEYSWYNSPSPGSGWLLSSKAFRVLPGLRNSSHYAWTSKNFHFCSLIRLWDLLAAWGLIQDLLHLRSRTVSWNRIRFWKTSTFFFPSQKSICALNSTKIPSESNHTAHISPLSMPQHKQLLWFLS